MCAYDFLPAAVLKFDFMMSRTLLVWLAITCCTSGNSAQEQASIYQVTGSCEVNQVCTYKYLGKQLQFGMKQEETISVGANIEILCNSVGIYNGTGATEYCMEIRKVSLTGPMVADSQRSVLERYETQKLAGWFCFVQTAEGKVASVFHDSTNEPQAVNFKKSIAAAFQANFKGTDEEEEIDPQSKHISHYSYFLSEGIQKMHRSVSSEDVESYSSGVQVQDIQLTKEEDIEFKFGTLQSSSGVTTVALAISKQQAVQKPLTDEEEETSGNVIDSDIFAANGSYRMELVDCYTISKSEKHQRKRKSVTNIIETTLSASINKRSIARQHLENLRQQIPSPLKVLMKIHHNPKSVHLASKLQRLLVLEAEYGPLPGTTPALTDVLHYLKLVNQSSQANNDEIKHTIHSLLAHEGTLDSQMALLNILVHGNDEEQSSVITHIAFIENPHIDFVKELELLIEEDIPKVDSLILAYSALASTATTSIQQRIVDFLKERLLRNSDLTSMSTVHLLHAFGNTGSERIIDLLLDYYWHSDSEEVKLAAIGGMRKLTDHKLVQDAFVTILRSTKDEAVVEEIANTLLTGKEYSHFTGVHIKENTHLLNALVDTCLQFRNNTQLHHLVHSYLQTVDTTESHRLAEMLSSTVRVRRASSDWDHSDSLYNNISPLSSRQSDVRSYPVHKAYLWGKRMGISKVNVEVATGIFAGVSSTGSKLFGKAIAKGNLFGRSSTIGEAFADGYLKINGGDTTVQIRLYVKIRGTVLTNVNIRISSDGVDIHYSRVCCVHKTHPLYNSARYKLIGFRYSVPIYIATINFYVQLNAEMNVNFQEEYCLNFLSCSYKNLLSGKVSLTPTATISPEGGAYLNVLSTGKVGISVAGYINYRIEPEADGSGNINCAGDIIWPEAEGSGGNVISCGIALRSCVNIYQSWPNNRVEIYAWYQLRSIKMCRASKWVGGFKYPCGIKWGSRKRCCISKNWSLGSGRRSKLWGTCIQRRQQLLLG